MGFQARLGVEGLKAKLYLELNRRRSDGSAWSPVWIAAGRVFWRVGHAVSNGLE
jgi:hypothetical protein